jgi:hypothetical protein
VHSTGGAVLVEAALIDVLETADVDDALELPDLPDEGEIYDGPLPHEQADAEAGEASEAAAEVQEGPVSKETRMQQILGMRPLEKIRTALLGDKYDRSLLVRDANKTVALAAIRSPKIRDDEAIAYSANRALPLEVITYISNRRDWIKLYSVKLNLVMNPKTPMARSMSLLAFLNRNDVMKVSRSKNIPSALATAAKRKLASRDE